MSDASSRRPKPRTDRKPPTGKPADRKPTDRRPTEGKPADRQAGDRKPYDRAASGRKPYDRKPTDGKPSERKPYDRATGKPSERKPYDRAAGKPGERKPYDRAGTGRPSTGRPTSGRPSSGRPGADRANADRKPYERTSSPRARDDEDGRPRHDDPEIPEEVTANLLDKVARAELKTLSKDNADWVARHLVMAGRLIEEDPALAHRHALAAGRRAGRVSVVRESVGITAYALGEFELALREFRTYRRLSGKNDQLPLMVDSERGVGRPEKALELGRSVPRAELESAVQVALAIAMSGARLDLGQLEAALGELQIPQLDPERAHVWSPALFDAYATVLEDLGRTEEAEEWWQRSDRATVALDQADRPEGDDTVEIIDEELAPDAEN